VIQFRFLGNLADLIPDGRLELEGDWRLGESLEAIGEEFPTLREALFDPETGGIQDTYNVVLNGEMVRFSDLGLEQPLADGDVVQIFPPVAGGR
jgi:MoaD family protein